MATPTYAPANSLPFQIPENQVFSQEFPQFIIQFTDSFTKLAKASNSKDVGIYWLSELLTGKAYPDANNTQYKKQSYRKCFVFGAIAAGATLNVPINVTGTANMTDLRASCVTATPDQRPIPYADAAVVTNQISIGITGAAPTQAITIINGATAPAIVSGFIIFEYIKS